MPVVNVAEAVQRIRQAGSVNSRIVPMAGETPAQGRQQIEVLVGGQWQVVALGLSQRMAEDIIAQATNRVILG